MTDGCVADGKHQDDQAKPDQPSRLGKHAQKALHCCARAPICSAMGAGRLREAGGGFGLRRVPSGDVFVCVRRMGQAVRIGASR